MRTGWLCVLVAAACTSPDAPGNLDAGSGDAAPLDAGPGDAAPVDAGPVDATPLPTHCGAAGSLETIATGVLAGMDATRVFVWNDGALNAWPKGGGVPTRIATQRSLAFAASGPALYWGNGATVVASEAGSQRTIPLTNPAAAAYEIIAAPGGGVFVLSSDTKVSTIELIGPGAIAPTTVVTAAYVSTMAAGGDALVWNSALSQIMQRSSSTGVQQVLVQEPEVGGPLLVRGHELFNGRYTTPNTTEVETIQRRRLSDGMLLASYPGRAGPYTNIGVDDTTLYVAKPRDFSIGPSGACQVVTGLFRTPLAGGPEALIDPSGTGKVLVDDDAVYYQIQPISTCCSRENCVSGPLTVGCYRK